MSTTIITDNENKGFTDSDYEYTNPLGSPRAEEATLIKHRIFLNNVDTYHGKHLAEFLTDQIYGASKGEGDAGEGMEEEELEAQAIAFQKPIGSKYEIIGTLKYKFGKKSEDILETISEHDKDHFQREIIKCGFIVYDISEDDTQIAKALETLAIIEADIEEVKTVGPKHFQDFNESRVFVLISTVMTWGNTKPIDPDEPETPFNESDYKKRKAHPNFAQHIACEREVVLKGRKYKDKLKTYVICAGMTYGYEEDQLFFLFKLAWNNEKHLPVFGNGSIPLIHVRDLAKVLHALFENVPKKLQYILAVEQTPCKLRQVVKALSKAMGRGRIRDTTQEEAFLYNNMTQTIFDRYTVNLSMEPTTIVDDWAIEFKNDLNLAENMKAIVTEFRIARNLTPLRILIHGPPAAGKTLLAKKIADHYGVRYISVQTLIEDTLQDLKETIEEQIAYKKEKEAKQAAQAEEDDAAEEEVEEEEEEDDDAGIEELEEKVRDIESTIANSENNRLPDDYVVRLLKEFLSSNNCQNQGYVLDGYPKTMEQVKEMFGQSADAGEEASPEEEGEAAPSISIVPMYVISLEADDDFLCERVMKQPERDIQGTHYSEEHMLRRLAEFRAANTEDNTILNFFDEIEIHPIVLNIVEIKDDTADMAVVFNAIKTNVGVPIGFQLTPEEEEELLACQEAAGLLIAENERIEKELLEQRALEDYQLKMEEKLHLMEKYQMEEETLIIAQCEPLRSYLMRFIFPTLTKGLLEVARLKPSDPVDYLAEFLFKCNPEGKMFDPGYTRTGIELNEATIGDKVNHD